MTQFVFALSLPFNVSFSMANINLTIFVVLVTSLVWQLSIGTETVNDKLQGHREEHGTHGHKHMHLPKEKHLKGKSEGHNHGKSKSGSDGNTQILKKILKTEEGIRKELLWQHRVYELDNVLEQENQNVDQLLSRNERSWIENLSHKAEETMNAMSDNIQNMNNKVQETMNKWTEDIQSSGGNVEEDINNLKNRVDTRVNELYDKGNDFISNGNKKIYDVMNEAEMVSTRNHASSSLYFKGLFKTCILCLVCYIVF